MKIYNVSGELIFENDSFTMKRTVEAALAAGVSLRGANLEAVCLRGANLQHADLHGANLREANLYSAYLGGANLCETYLPFANLSFANLLGANLRGANLLSAVLQWADLQGANLNWASLRNADLRGVNFQNVDLRDAILPEGVPVIPNIHQAVYEAASKPGALDMSEWHKCGSTHCRAGWVVTLAGEEGRALENKFGPSAAAALIYMASDPTLDRVPNWRACNWTALEDMKRLASLS